MTLYVAAHRTGIFCSRACYTAVRGGVEDRFWARVDRDDPDGCWLWTGDFRPNGYGRLSIGNRGVAAHRLAYRLLVGPIPRHAVVCHRCDVKACVRPDHLFLGTAADNVADMDAKGRRASLSPPRLIGEAHPAAKLTELDVLAVRARHAAGAREAELAREHGVTVQAVRAIVQRKTWKHVA